MDPAYMEDTLRQIRDEQRLTNALLKELVSFARQRKAAMTEKDTMTKKDDDRTVDTGMASDLITKLNKEVMGYRDYDKVSAPLLSMLRQMGFTTRAVKV